jgi:hypothetical protein
MNSTNNATIHSLPDAVLKMAQGQLGQSEEPVGSNSGPMVNEYLKCVGLNPGYAWCQAFVYWCYNSAAKQLHLTNPMYRTAGVHDCWNHQNAKGVKLLKTDALTQPERLKAGDQFILLFGVNEGHTGIIEKVEGTTIYTIEGNSNTNGSREGYEVVRHQRSLNDAALQGFIQYS